jgi:hypothetical protein
VFTAAYNIKKLISGYQSIDMHCIKRHVKFDNGLSISVLRNKQLLKKMDVNIFKWFRFFDFQTPPFGERADLGKSLTFLALIFLVNVMNDQTSNLT